MALWHLLAALTLAALVLRDERVIRASVVLLADWALLTVICDVSGDGLPWKASLAVDWLAALAILLPGTGRIGALIGLSYGVEIIAHMAFGLSPKGYPQQLAYWWVLHWGAWTQAWLLLAWELGGGGRRVVDAVRRRRGVFRVSHGAAPAHFLDRGASGR